MTESGTDLARKHALTVIFLTVFIDLLGFGIVLPLLPVYAKDFGHSLPSSQVGIVIGLLMASFSIMQFLFAPLWGRLSDRIGRRPVLLVGLAGSVVFYALFGLATVYKSLLGLFVTRIGAGIAGATISTAHAYIADSTPREQRTKGMALVGAAFGLGFTFGPLLGFFAVPSGTGDPGPGPGYAAAILSAIALGLAWFRLPESLQNPQAAIERRRWSSGSLADALATPSVGLLLVAVFVSVLSFANFESTLAVFVKDSQEFTFRQLCLTFAFVGLVLTIVQGGIVRRVAGRIPEVVLAAGGGVVEIVGFTLLAQAGPSSPRWLLFSSLAIVVTGFAFITPSLNSLLSRRSDPAKQGGILGVAQSVSSLARILGPLAGLSLFHLRPPASTSWPFWLAAALMGLSLAVVLVAGRSGMDYATEPQPQSSP